jgi:hypothetical protein
VATALLLDGGFFGFDRGDCLHGQLWWFDDYDMDLGAPLEPSSKAAMVRARSPVTQRGLGGQSHGNHRFRPGEITLPGGIRQAGLAAFAVPPFDARIMPRSGVSVR